MALSLAAQKAPCELNACAICIKSLSETNIAMRALVLLLCLFDKVTFFFLQKLL